MTYYHNGKPYVCDIDMWRKHFMDMATGLVHPDVNRRCLVGQEQSGGKKSDDLQMKMVTSVAQAIEMDKSELALENERNLYKGVYNMDKKNLKYARRQWGANDQEDAFSY
jgi:hypothetical protein